MAFAQANYNYTVGSHKAGVSQLILPPTIIGTNAGTGSWYNRPGNFSFEDGTPDPEESDVTPTAYVAGPSGAGFELSIKADTTSRTLRLYCSASAPAQLKAYLSDGSAPVVVDTSLQNSNAQYVFTINFNAASAGQTLVIRFDRCEWRSDLSQCRDPQRRSSPSATAGYRYSAELWSAGKSCHDYRHFLWLSIRLCLIQWNPGLVLSWSETTINAFVPAGVSTGPVTVVTSGGASNANVSSRWSRPSSRLRQVAAWWEPWLRSPGPGSALVSRQVPLASMERLPVLAVGVILRSSYRYRAELPQAL